MSRMDAPEVRSRIVGSWALIDGDRALAAADNWDKMETALSDLPSIASAPNAIATLVAPNGDILAIGIASSDDGDNPGLKQPLASVEFNDASQGPPYLVVVGDPTLTYENGGVVVFRFGGQWTEALRRNCVPVDEVLPIVKHFFQTGTLPDWVSWEQV